MLYCLFQAPSLLAQVDTSYIQKYQDNTTIKVSGYHNYLGLTIGRPDTLGDIYYNSNTPFNLGVAVAHPKLPFELSLGYGIVGRNKAYVKTRAIDFQFNRYGRKYVLDFSFQNYSGFYIDNPDLQPENSNRLDLSMFEMTCMGQYVFNWEHFSYQAAFDQSERQMKSAGSFLLGGGLYLFSVKTKNSYIFNKTRKIKNYQLGVNVGYAYNWVLSEHLLFSGSLNIGANMGNDQTNLLEKSKLHIKPLVLTRFSVFYNEANWAFGFSEVSSTVWLMFAEKRNDSVGFGRLMLTFLYRFYHKKNLAS